MPRTQYTFTFRNAEPGAAVTFSDSVYSSPADQTADGPALALDTSRSVAVWADVSELTATWVDGAGTSIEAEASVDVPVVVETGGVAGASPAPSGGSIAVAKITGELFLTGAQMVSDGSGLGGYQVVAADMTLTEIQGTSGVTIGDWPGDPTIGAVLLHEPGDYDYALYVSPTLTPNAGVTTLRSLGVGFAGGGVGNSAGLDATFPLPVNNLIQQTVRGQPAWSVPGSGLANSALQAPFFFPFDGSATDALDISFILHVWKM